MINQHLRSIRELEAQQVLPWLPASGRLLEIGAGAGWQASQFAAAGLDVFAIDLAGSPYLPHTRFPTIRYDGFSIPFADASFDVVYSSNVLEHIPHVEAFQREIRRVLRPNGRIIHVLPTPAWRMATSFTHYVHGIRRLIKRPRQGANNSDPPSHHKTPRRGPRLGVLLPSRHGEYGNWVTEVFYFSKWRWLRLFKRAGLELEATRALGLFYTGYSVADAALTLKARKRLSLVLGSACRLFVLRLR
jgi:SAM-dependent methyltransferase